MGGIKAAVAERLGAPTHEFRMTQVIRVATPIGIVAHASFIILFWMMGVPLMSVFNVASVAAWIAARQFNEKGWLGPAVSLIVVEVIAHAVLAVWLTGWESGFHYYLIPLLSFMLFDDRPRSQLLTGVAFLVPIIYLALWALAPHGPPPGVNGSLVQALVPLHVLVPFATLATISCFFRAASLRIEQRMELLANTDPLTLLPNRRQMLSLLESQVEAFRRGKQTIGLLIGDLDRFKTINDTLGHDVGDDVLRAVAERLSGASRGSDVVARWGGEEFLIMLPGADLERSRDVAERMRAAVRARPIRVQERDVQVTITFGVSCWTAPMSLSSCLQQADAALYRGKDAGRDQVMLCPVGSAEPMPVQG